MGVLIAVALFVVEATLHGCTCGDERADGGTPPSTALSSPQSSSRRHPSSRCAFALAWEALRGLGEGALPGFLSPGGGRQLLLLLGHFA